jgi:putative ABC transport system permease protein
MFASLRAVFARLRAVFYARRLDGEFDQEVQCHLAMLTEENMRCGMSRNEARYAALRSFGGIAQAKERNREHRGVRQLEIFWQDFRYACRTFSRNRGFAMVAVLTLALGIGANTAIFSAFYAALLKPLPFRDPDRLLSVWKKNLSRGWGRNAISAAEFVAWRERSTAFEDMAAFQYTACVLTGAGEPEDEPCEVIGSNLFPLLGVAPVRGRNFSAAEDRANGPRVVILSHELWQRRFGADERTLGQTIDLNGHGYTVVGIMPAGFSHLYASPYSAVPAMWISGIELSSANTWNDWHAVGRLRSGAKPEQAASQMDAVSFDVGQAHPDLQGWRADLLTLRALASRDTRTTLAVLMGAVTFVLLIACTNVAHLLLARGARRTNEFAVRKALGAGQARLLRQLLTESLLISLAGGALGILSAWWGNKGLVALAPAFLVNSAPSLAVHPLDLRVLAFAVTISLSTTLLFGLAPAIESARWKSAETLKEDSRGSRESPRSRRFRGVLIILETSLAVVLLVGAGLMIRTLVQLSRTRLGFNPANVLTLQVRLVGNRYKEPHTVAQFWRQVVSSAEALPGVESASVSRGLPIDGWSGLSFTTADQPDPPPGQVPDANYTVAGPDYFRTLQIPLRRGRPFVESDADNTERVAIVNQELARIYWPNQEPLGKKLRMKLPANDGPWLTVVGVAGNVLSRGPDGGFHAEIYVPYQQLPWVLEPRHLVVRTAPTVAPASVANAVVEEIHQVDKNQPVDAVKTMEQIATENVGEERMVMALLGGFAALALILAGLGIYSVLAYTVAQRTREIGVRVALGAQRNDVLRLVVGNGLRLTLVGIAAGSAAALGLTRLMTDLLYAVRPGDPLTFVAGAIILAATALLACYLPARRAARIDPMMALRHE